MKLSANQDVLVFEGKPIQLLGSDLQKNECEVLN
jgi:hypothetical protein